MRGLEKRMMDSVMLHFAAPGPGGPPNPNAPVPPGPNALPAQPPNQAPDNFTLSRKGHRLTMRDPVRNETINSPDENIIRQAVEDFLRRNHLIPQSPAQGPMRLRIPRFGRAPTTTPVTALNQPPAAQVPPTPNVVVNQPPAIHVDGSRPRELARNKYVITGILGALLLGGYLGYEVRDHNLLNMSANTRFTSQTIAPGQCVDAPGGSIAVRKAAINGVVLYSQDPQIEMVTRLNEGAQVCATGGEPVTIQYLGGNSQLMDTVEQNDINLMQANGCNGRRCNKVTPITYPYP